MQQCSKEDVEVDIARLLYNISTSFVFLFLFFYFSFIFLAYLFSFLSNLSVFTRAQIGYGAGMFSDEDEEEEDEDEARCFNGRYVERDHLVADVVHGGETQILQFPSSPKREVLYKFFEHDNDQTMKSSHEDQFHEATTLMFDVDTSLSEPEEGKETSLDDDDDDDVDDDFAHHEDPNQEDHHEDDVAGEPSTSPITLELNRNGSSDKDDKNHTGN